MPAKAVFNFFPDRLFLPSLSVRGAMSIEELPDYNSEHTVKLLTLLNVAAARPRTLKRKRIPERDWTALAKAAKKASVQTGEQPISARIKDSAVVDQFETGESATG
jgi:hypothetical protein